VGTLSNGQDWLPRKSDRLRAESAAPAKANGATHDEWPDEQPDDRMVPPFPTSAWRGIFDIYRKANAGTTEASDVAHFCALWVAAAVTLGRGVWMYDGREIFANPYLAFMGPTGDKKTTAQRRTQTLLVDDHGVAILRNTGSVQGMADAITARSRAGVSLLIPEELSVVYSEGHAEHSQLFEFLTETFDCGPRFEKNYRGSKVLITTPTPTVFACGTAAWFWRHARDEDFAGGLGNRFLHFDGPPKEPIPRPCRPDEELLNEVRKRVAALSGLSAEALFTHKAGKLFDHFYSAFKKAEKKRPPLLADAVKRIPVYVRKLAMVYGGFEASVQEISEDQTQACIDVAEYAIGCAERLIDQKSSSGRHRSNSELEQKIIRWLSKRGGEGAKRNLQQDLSYACDAETLNRVLTSLVRLDRIWIEDSHIRLL
jgi:hypothetical protein